MTRAQDGSQKRRRTPRACEKCKHRRIKCDGKLPCGSCQLRSIQCAYDLATPKPSRGGYAAGSANPVRHELSPRLLREDPGNVGTQPSRDLGTSPLWSPSNAASTEQLKHLHRYWAKSNNAGAFASAPNGSYRPQWRMVQDTSGRLLYFGDSADLSYLQWVRMVNGSVCGPSDFTLDLQLPMVVEDPSYPPLSRFFDGILSRLRIANTLIDNYFVNTAGLVELFDRQLFHMQVDQLYESPSESGTLALCTLYMVFALGYVLAKPMPSGGTEAVKGILPSDSIARANFLFHKTKNLIDPVCGLEDADFWSIQVLVLMSLYKLSISKHNASYAYCGMIIRSASALGLHRQDCDFPFTPIEIKTRRNLWRSLFVLDRFLAASLGRPMAIPVEDAPDLTRTVPEDRAQPELSFEEKQERISAVALSTAVRTSYAIGTTLQTVYSRSGEPGEVENTLAEQLKRWNNSLDPALYWCQPIGRTINPSHRIAILHVNIMQCYSVILFTRHSFQEMVERAHKLRPRPSHNVPSLCKEAEGHVEACIEASQHILVLAQAAVHAHYLPYSNPFVLNPVFIAALILMSNILAALTYTPDLERYIQSYNPFSDTVPTTIPRQEDFCGLSVRSTRRVKITR